MNDLNSIRGRLSTQTFFNGVFNTGDGCLRLHVSPAGELRKKDLSTGAFCQVASGAPSTVLLIQPLPVQMPLVLMRPTPSKPIDSSEA